MYPRAASAGTPPGSNRSDVCRLQSWSVTHDHVDHRAGLRAQIREPARHANAEQIPRPQGFDAPSRRPADRCGASFICSAACVEMSTSKPPVSL